MAPKELDTKAQGKRSATLGRGIGRTCILKGLPGEHKWVISGERRRDVAVAVECLFCWYWLADLCAEEEIPFVLGHAPYTWR